MIAGALIRAALDLLADRTLAAVAFALILLGVLLVTHAEWSRSRSRPMIPPPPVPATPPVPVPPAPAAQSFRVLAVEPVEYAYGKTRFRLSEFDPADASRVYMGSVAIEAAEVGVFAGLRAGDVVVVSTSTSGTGKGEGGRA